MNMLYKIKKKIKDGSLKEMLHEARWIGRYIKKHKLSIVFYIFLYIFATLSGLCNTVASKYLVDNITGKNYGFVINIALFYIAFGLFEIILNAITSRISVKINIKIVNGMRADVYNSIILSDIEHIQEYHSGDLLNRINSDVSTVSGSVIGWLPGLITRLVQFTGAFLIILYYDPVMALLALASAPVTILVSRVLVNRMRKHNKEMREVSSEIMSFHEESFSNICTVKALNIIPKFIDRHYMIQEKYAKKSIEYNKFSVITGLFMSLTGMIVSYICLGWGMYRLWFNYITFGTMVLFLQLAGTLRSSFSAIVSLVPSAVSATTSAGRIKAITELPKDNVKIMNDSLLKKGLSEGVAISLSNIDFSYRNGNKILSNVSIMAKARETIALVGPSGEGKTTAIKIILGLLKIQGGTYSIFIGDSCSKSIYQYGDLRNLFSYVPQNNILFTGTIAENLRYVKEDVSDEEIWEVLRIADAFDFVSELPEGIYTGVGEGGFNFSEGQKQRLSIARALIRKTPVLLMDEATSALDADTEKKVLMNIRAMKEDITCIITTHRPSVLDICDRVYKISSTKAYELECCKQDVKYG